MLLSVLLGGAPLSSSAPGSPVHFLKEDFLTAILPSLVETDTVVFIFTLDGEREDGTSGAESSSGLEGLPLRVSGCLVRGRVS